MKLDLTELGISPEKLEELVVDRVSDIILHGIYDEHEGDFSGGMKRKFQDAIQSRIDKRVEEIADEHIAPRVEEMLANISLQATNSWGEKRGEPLSFVEYLIQRAEKYMLEEVNFEGKAKSEAGGYSWSKASTRVAYMVNKHLHYSIETAMKQAVADANKVIVGGLEQAVKIGLQNVAAGLKVKVETK